VGRACVWVAILLAGWIVFAIGEASAEGEAADSVPVEEAAVGEWLVAGPVSERLPLFEERNAAGWSRVLLEGLSFPVRDLWPRPGDSLEWRPGLSIEWDERPAPGGTLSLRPADSEASVVLLACYLDSPRWQRLECVVETRSPLVVYQDGGEVARKERATPPADETPETVAELTLPKGKSRLVIRTSMSEADSLDEWRLRVVLRVPTDRIGDAPAVSTSPRRTFARLDDLASVVASGTAVVAPDGSRFVVDRVRWMPEADRPERFIEVRSLPAGDLVWTVHPQAGVTGPRWSPDGSRLAVTVKAGEDAQDLWVLNLESGSFERILEGKKSLSNVTWTGDGRFLLYTTVSDDGSSEEEKYERLTEPYMRWPGWKDDSHLWIVSLADRVERPLTAGEFSVAAVAACPSLPLVAFLKRQPIEVRPYEKMELWTLDLEGREATLERELRFAVLSDLVFGPSGDRLAWVASPSETDTLSASGPHNAYEQDLYVWNRRARTLDRVTDEFRPSVGADLYGARDGFRDVWWTAGDDRIYFTATDGGRNRLYRTDPEGREIAHVPLEPSAVYGLSASDDGSTLLFYGSAIGEPERLYRYEPRRRRSNEVLFAGEEVYSQLSLGRTESWDFINSRGATIEGWVYYPPDFDPARTYPMIVYYYGGVFPNGEAYVWRNHYLAANGYVVYVLNPVGAVGYGPPFADGHVNDWGELAAQDVIEGVERLLAEKSFIDPDRVGAFGGSYGGFLTMQLLTKTDLFAAAEASYGISNITSYWGEGRWGYLYGDVAMAGSYPWNRPDIFVERSPLFRADKITTPLLLTHGTGDTNVPSGESDQMFTALRVLRRDVVYVRFPGQEHGIAGTQGIRIAHNEMRREWFDKYLKGQPEAWDARWEED